MPCRFAKRRVLSVESWKFLGSDGEVTVSQEEVATVGRGYGGAMTLILKIILRTV